MRLLVVLAGFLTLTTALSAQMDDESSRRTLAGLRGVEVVVEDLNPAVPHPGIEQSDIQTDVELKLREAGIPVLPKSQGVLSPGSPWLYVRLALFTREDGMYAYAIEVVLNQSTRMIRDASIMSTATTWEAEGTVGTVGENQLRDVRETIGDQVNQFVNAYLAANPKH